MCLEIGEYPVSVSYRVSVIEYSITYIRIVV